MKIIITAVGKCKEEEKKLADRYQKRITKWQLEIKEIQDSLKQAEQEKKITSLINNTSTHFILDINGENLNSEEFSKEIAGALIKGNLAFSIGGADGFSKEFKNTGSKLISFGRATFPHQLARVMLLEQIYRTQCILNLHPYHH